MVSEYLGPQYLAVCVYDDEEDEEEWHNGNSGGGCTIPFGEFMGRAVNRTPILYLEDLHRSTEHEMRETHVKFFDALDFFLESLTVYAERNYQKFIVPFGKYQGKQIRQCRDKDWFKWVIREPKLPQPLPIFIHAVGHHLNNPRHYEVTRDIGRKTIYSGVADNSRDHPDTEDEEFIEDDNIQADSVDVDIVPASDDEPPPRRQHGVLGFTYRIGVQPLGFMSPVPDSEPPTPALKPARELESTPEPIAAEDPTPTPERVITPGAESEEEPGVLSEPEPPPEPHRTLSARSRQLSNIARQLRRDEEEDSDDDDAATSTSASETPNFDFVVPDGYISYEHSEAEDKAVVAQSDSEHGQSDSEPEAAPLRRSSNFQFVVPDGYVSYEPSEEDAVEDSERAQSPELDVPETPRKLQTRREETPDASELMDTIKPPSPLVRLRKAQLQRAIVESDREISVAASASERSVQAQLGVDAPLSRSPSRPHTSRSPSSHPYTPVRAPLQQPTPPESRPKKRKVVASDDEADDEHEHAYGYVRMRRNKRPRPSIVASDDEKITPDDEADDEHDDGHRSPRRRKRRRPSIVESEDAMVEGDEDVEALPVQRKHKIVASDDEVDDEDEHGNGDLRRSKRFRPSMLESEDVVKEEEEEDGALLGEEIPDQQQQQRQQEEEEEDVEDDARDEDESIGDNGLKDEEEDDSKEVSSKPALRVGLRLRECSDGTPDVEPVPWTAVRERLFVYGTRRRHPNTYQAKFKAEDSEEDVKPPTYSLRTRTRVVDYEDKPWDSGDESLFGAEQTVVIPRPRTRSHSRSESRTMRETQTQSQTQSQSQSMLYVEVPPAPWS